MSPKVLASTAVVVVAAIALAIITGDKTYLVAVLLGIVGGGAGAVAPPLPGLKISTAEATKVIAPHKRR